MCKNCRTFAISLLWPPKICPHSHVTNLAPLWCQEPLGDPKPALWVTQWVPMEPPDRQVAVGRAPQNYHGHESRRHGTTGGVAWAVARTCGVFCAPCGVARHVGSFRNKVKPYSVLPPHGEKRLDSHMSQKRKDKSPHMRYVSRRELSCECAMCLVRV